MHINTYKIYCRASNKYAWKYSAQEARYMLDVCTKKAGNPGKKVLHALCDKAADDLIKERSQGKKSTSEKTKILTALRALHALGLLVDEIDFDVIKERGFREDLELSEVFKQDFIGLCNDIFEAEEEEE